ncbi:MAG: hypothetical protein Q8891_05650 [Bacteroidota bacterium]|nr:hypothetical protein [Bacteroidota bacterium]
MKNKMAFFSLVTLMMFLGHSSSAQNNQNGQAGNKRFDTTSLVNADSLKDTNDSLRIWKHSREFAYMNYLDSLLRKKTDLKSDTVNIDQATGKVNRQQKKKGNYSRLNQFLNSFPLKIFFWVLAIIFIIFIFYKIFFKSGIFKIKKYPPDEEDNEDYLSELDNISKYDLLINEAEANNDFNLSTRYLFLRTLKTLSDKGFIHFAPEKTNSEYLQDMVSSGYQLQFASLIRNYEYVWYGKFLIDKNKYEQLKKEFIQFNKNS